MPKKDYDAYSLFCKSLDTMGSALEFGSSLARAAAKANEQLTQAWEFPDAEEQVDCSDEREPPTERPDGPSAIELAREAVSRRIEELTGAPAERAIESEELVAAPPPTSEPEPAATTRQADKLDERAQRLLARFVDPGPDFFKKSPFEDWDTFSVPKNRRHDS
ncbi:MAG: hypothetical protein AAFR65_05350 [Pseudomonadota bacterium]